MIALGLPTRYRAQQLPDGRVEVRGVPIFAETQPTATRRRGYGRAWLEGFLARADKRRGYEAPLHLHHTDTGRAEAVGTWVPERVALREVDGAPRWVLFATLRYTSPEAFARAKAYPHRSVEISPDHPDEINSLALLDAEAPYHRFPNLVTFRAARGEAFMADEKKPEAPAAPAAEKKPEAMAAEAPAPAAAPAAPGLSLEGLAAKVDQLAVVVAKLVEAEQAESAILTSEAKCAEPAVMHTAARDEGRLEGQAAKIAELERRLAGNDAFAALSEKLGPLASGAEGKKRLDGLRKKIDTRGIDAATDYVEGLLESYSTASLRVTDAKLGAGSQAPQDAPEVLAYAAAGSSKLAEAREAAAFHAQWHSRPERFAKLADYLNLQIGAPPKKVS